MATLIAVQAIRRLKDGELLYDKPGGHARWKLGKDTVREVTVNKWIKYKKISELSPGAWGWSGGL